MRRWAWLLVLIPFTTSGCGSESHEKLLEEMIRLLNRTTEILDTIKDKDSALKAKEELAKVRLEFRKVKEKLDRIDKDDKNNDKLKQQYEARISEAANKVLTKAREVKARVPEAEEILKSIEQ